MFHYVNAQLVARVERIMSNDDIVLWSDGTWCYGSEFPEMTFMSDDYQILKFGTIEHFDFQNMDIPF